MAEVVCMPWGKHKGKPLAEVPAGYLDCGGTDAAMREILPAREALERVLG